ncbi:unnamed protein product [Caenorhabditis nigoni]
MNKVLQNYIDSFPTAFENIWITDIGNELRCKLNGNEYECKTEGDGCTFSKPKCLIIENSEENCYYCKRNDKITETYEESYMKKGLEYLTPLFKIPNLQTNHLQFISTIQTPEIDALLPVPFHAKSAYLNVTNLDKMVQLLSNLKAELSKSSRYVSMNHLEKKT